jgi:hypothetical protein
MNILRVGFRSAAALLVLSATANAAIVHGTGEYRFGPDTAESVACEYALDRARRNAIENAIGESIEYQTNEVCRNAACSTHRELYAETTGQIRRIINKTAVVAPDNRSSVCTVNIQADVIKLENKIHLTITSKHDLDHGERFTVNAIANRPGHYVIFNLYDDVYTTVHAGALSTADSETSLTGERELVATVPNGLYQSRELLVVLYAEKSLTIRPKYTRMEFEHLVNSIPFTGRKIVNYPLIISRK